MSTPVASMSAMCSSMEANERGTRAIALPAGESRLWLEDGDEILIRGRAEREGFVSIGFGPCDGRVAPAEARA